MTRQETARAAMITREATLYRRARSALAGGRITPAEFDKAADRYRRNVGDAA